MSVLALEKVAKALQQHMDNAVTADVAVGMRRPGSQTPAVVWEMTGAECQVTQPGQPAAAWIVTCEVNIYGDTALGVIQVADDIVDYWDNPTTLGATYAKLVLTAISTSMRTESQADGSEGDERVCTMTFTFQGI
jgi:hypothetical protein